MILAGGGTRGGRTAGACAAGACAVGAGASTLAPQKGQRATPPAKDAPHRAHVADPTSAIRSYILNPFLGSRRDIFRGARAIADPKSRATARASGDRQNWGSKIRGSARNAREDDRPPAVPFGARRVAFARPEGRGVRRRLPGSASVGRAITTCGRTEAARGDAGSRQRGLAHTRRAPKGTDGGLLRNANEISSVSLRGVPDDYKYICSCPPYP